jgi:hypothetical protein
MVLGKQRLLAISSIGYGTASDQISISYEDLVRGYRFANSGESREKAREIETR